MKRVAAVWAAILAAFIVATSVYGGYHYFSPIPYWDQWDGYIGFYKALEDGQYGFFWSQHMEHRIVFSRILFLLDIVVFGGRNAFTVAMNYVLLLAVAGVIWREYAHGKSIPQSPWVIGGLVVGFLFAWCQSENLKWGFQSQGIAVYLFAFLAFAVYSRPEHPVRRLTLAILFSLLAVISMGNGVATFAILIGQAILLRRSWREWAAILVAGIVSATVYFRNYHKPTLPIEPSVAHMALVRPRFFAIFLGSPIRNNLELCAFIGLCFFAIALLLIGKLYFRREVTPYRAFLAAIIGMVVVSAVGASNGRWMQGLAAAVSSRYTTPVLMGYAALSLLALDVAKTRFARVGALLVPLIILTVVARFQPNSYADAGYLYNWKLAVLGQKIGLDHPQFESAIYPLDGLDRFRANADFAAADNIGPYGRGWLHDAGIVKFDPMLVNAGLCEGFIESQSADTMGLIAHGWAVARRFKEPSLLIVLVDANGQTLGYGVTGQARADVARSIHGAPDDSGWIGFAKTGVQPLHAYAYVGGKFCPLAAISH